MSAAVAQVIPLPPGPRTEPKSALPRRPAPATREVMRAVAQRLLSEGFDYRESVAAFKALLADVALDQAGRSRKKASARLGISREILRRHKARAGECGL
jgi:DNA-binding NtrC family response regulator